MNETTNHPGGPPGARHQDERPSYLSRIKSFPDPQTIEYAAGAAVLNLVARLAMDPIVFRSPADGPLNENERERLQTLASLADEGTDHVLHGIGALGNLLTKEHGPTTGHHTGCMLSELAGLALAFEDLKSAINLVLTRRDASVAASAPLA